MVTTWFTSDNHYFHRNIKKFCPNTRHGDTVEEMNELMILKWNSLVQPQDVVWTLGDFSFGKTRDTCNILRRLNGNINLVFGNHDQWFQEATCAEYFDSVQQYKELKIGGRHVVLFHYPIVQWNKMHYGGYHLYGHVHGSYTHSGRAMDVGIDARPQADMGLWHWDEIDSHLGKRPVLDHHGKVEM